MLARVLTVEPPDTALIMDLAPLLGRTPVLRAMVLVPLPGLLLVDVSIPGAAITDDLWAVAAPSILALGCSAPKVRTVVTCSPVSDLKQKTDGECALCGDKYTVTRTAINGLCHHTGLYLKEA